MLSMNVLIPTTPRKTLIFNIKDYKIGETVELTGLRHKGINLLLTKTLNSLKEKNDSASKMISYLMNPCIIYDTEVYGDCILRIEIPDNSPAKQLLPSGRREQLNKVMDIIENVYKEKDNGIIPSDLYEWCKKREIGIIESIGKMKQEGKSTTSIEKALDHLRESMNSYGKKIPLPTLNMSQPKSQ